MRRSRPAVVVAVVALLTTGCGDDGGTGAVPDPAETVVPLSPGRAGGVVGDVLRTDEELVDARPVPLDAWEPVGEDVLRVHVVSGVPECFGAVVDLEEDEHQIRVGVSVGVLVSAAELHCVAVAVEAVVEVAVEVPVGDREVVDMNAGS